MRLLYLKRLKNHKEDLITMAKTYPINSMGDCRAFAEKTLSNFYQGKGHMGGFAIPMEVTSNMSFLGRFFTVDGTTLEGISNPSNRYYTRVTKSPSSSQSLLEYAQDSIKSDYKKELIFSKYEFNNKLLKINVGIQFGSKVPTDIDILENRLPQITWKSIAVYELKDKVLVGRRKEIETRKLDEFNPVVSTDFLTDLEKVSTDLLSQLKSDLDILNHQIQDVTNFHFISGNNNEHIGILGEETPLQYIEKDSTVDLKV